MIKVGITERGDPSLDFSWIDKLLSANIIITKNLNDTLIEHFIQNKDKIILHITCTGYGNSILEPYTPDKIITHKQIYKLIKNGFPVNQIVLRIDPIIPTSYSLRERVEEVLNLFKDTGIKRVRYSFLDMYPHVKERFIKANLLLPYDTFHCPDYMKENAINLLKQYEDIYEFEACAENTFHQLGCISQKDFNILGIKEEIEPVGYQRKDCMCIAGKTELLNNKKKCPLGCLYCYWKD